MFLQVRKLRAPSAVQSSFWVGPAKLIWRETRTDDPLGKVERFINLRNLESVTPFIAHVGVPNDAKNSKV